MFTHPDYDRFHENGPKNDIALLRLARPVEISPAVNTLCLPPPRSGREDDYFEETVVIGWGKTDSGRNSDILQKLDLKVIPNDECAEEYRTNLITTGRATR